MGSAHQNNTARRRGAWSLPAEACASEADGRMNPEQAIRFIEKCGVVLQAARGPVPSLAAEIAGERIKGSWWAHPKAHEIFRTTQAVSSNTDVLVCKLIDGKITYVHRRLWPAVVKLAS